MDEVTYNIRAQEIHAWAEAQYKARKLTEPAIEARVERMFDQLDRDYCNANDTGYRQTRDSVDCDPDAYPGWHVMQSAMRAGW